MNIHDCIKDCVQILCACLAISDAPSTFTSCWRDFGDADAFDCTASGKALLQGFENDITGCESETQ